MNFKLQKTYSLSLRICLFKHKLISMHLIGRTFFCHILIAFKTNFCACMQPMTICYKVYYPIMWKKNSFACFLLMIDHWRPLISVLGSWRGIFYSRFQTTCDFMSSCHGLFSLLFSETWNHSELISFNEKCNNLYCRDTREWQILAVISTSKIC